MGAFASSGCERVSHDDDGGGNATTATHPFFGQVIGMGVMSSIEIDKLLERVVRVVVLCMAMIV